MNVSHTACGEAGSSPSQVTSQSLFMSLRQTGTVGIDNRVEQSFRGRMEARHAAEVEAARAVLAQPQHALGGREVDVSVQDEHAVDVR